MAELDAAITSNRNQCVMSGACPSPMIPASSTDCTNGTTSINVDGHTYPCQNIALHALIPLADLGSAGEGSDIWGWTSPSGVEYVLMGCTDGLSIVDVSNSTSPAVVGWIPTHTVSSIWRDMKVYKHHLFIVADKAQGHGMQVFNLSRLQNTTHVTASAERRGRVSSPPQRSSMWTDSVLSDLEYDIGSAAGLNPLISEEKRLAHRPMHTRAVPRTHAGAGLLSMQVQSLVTLTPDTVYTGFGSAHNLVMNEETGFAYAVGSNTCAGGLHMIDVREPQNPVFVGCFASDGYTHDAQCVVYKGPDTAYIGYELCFAYNEDTLTIVNVSDKSNPVQISRTSYPGAKYVHQGWLTEDHSHILMDDEFDEYHSSDKRTRSLIWDISSLSDPQLIGKYVSNLFSIDHNQFVHNGLVYQANYCAGLRILNASHVWNGTLTEVAYFDVDEGCSTTTFNGAWGVFPYFASGLIAVSSIERGLYLFKSPAGALTINNAIPQVQPDTPAAAATSDSLVSSHPAYVAGGVTTLLFVLLWLFYHWRKSVRNATVSLPTEYGGGLRNHSLARVAGHTA